MSTRKKIPACETIRKDRPRQRCEHWTRCHKTEILQCGIGMILLPWEKDPTMQVPPPEPGRATGGAPRQRTQVYQSWNTRRLELLDLLDRAPGGLTNQEIATATGGDLDTARKWTRQLREEQEIVISDFDGRAPRFIISAGSVVPPMINTRWEYRRAEILDLLDRAPAGLTNRKISKAINGAYATIQTWTRRLKRSGLIVVGGKEGRAPVFVITPAGVQALKLEL